MSNDLPRPSDDRREQRTTRDPSQLIPPYIDTSIEILGPLTTADLLLYLPAGIGALVALFALLSDSWLFFPALIAAGALTFVATAAKLTTDWYSSPRGRVEAWLSHRWRSRTLPWDHEDVVGRSMPGVRGFQPEGTAKMDDGRYVGVVRVDPTNAALGSEREHDNLAAQLSSVIDEGIKDFDFKLFATTGDYDPEAVVGQYERRAASADTLDSDFQTAMYKRELLEDVADWYRETDRPQWAANDWRYYVVVEVPPEDVQSPEDVSVWDMLNPLSSVDPAKADERQYATLLDRLSTVEGAVGGITGLNASRIGVREHIELLSEYWTGQDAVPSENLIRAIEEEELSEAQQARMDELFAPDDLDASGDFLQVGDEFCRTFWIAEWPVEPESLFLRDLFTLRGVDVDVCFHVGAADKRTKVAELEQVIADIESEGHERRESSDVSAADIDRDVDAYVKYRELLRTTRTQPWDFSGYVTVRADTEAALRRAESAIEEFDEVEFAKRSVLDDDTESVRDTLESSPADCFTVVPTSRQLEAFRSGAPTGRDAFDEASRMDKTTSVPGGAVGATFPFCGTDVREPTGMDWGRNKQNGAMLKADPFERESAPHLLTIGKSRSGKTYASTKAAARWYLQSEDHTLILCDTQSGFDGITKLLGGEHIVVDGTQTINPLDIQPLPDHIRESAGGRVDPYRMKIEEATQFFAGILRSQGIDPGPYVATIEEGLEGTYNRAGIYQDDLDSHARESPTIEDFIDTLGDMLENPESYTHTEHAAEIDQKVERVSDLLDKLSGFKEGGKYHHLETGAGIMNPDVDMAYLDLQQLRDASDAEKSIMLQLMLGQVAQKAKRTRGKLVFMIDEAHVLFHSEEMTRWLQKAAREWARYDAALWFISQSPREFIQQSSERDVGQENERRTIVDQCSTINFFRTPRVAPETLAQFGLNRQQIDWIREEATPGKAGQGYSECLTYFEDYEGWFPTYVEASPFEDLVYNYTPREHGNFHEYVQRLWGPVEEGIIVDGEITVDPSVPLTDSRTAEAAPVTDGKGQDPGNASTLEPPEPEDVTADPFDPGLDDGPDGSTTAAAADPNGTPPWLEADDDEPDPDDVDLF
ncbi:hypothetical protein BV210_10470 [Halorientalis sp. IM1011]|uniref:VirB4 family type IV secretion system protein n=1 Tax=Halorientalis sp. IM1011 TaxID=1932360 RepID=UPI00097CCF69|nr:hypothetical protein [Halorientalis sp. IM1011]AQL43113.1 hypothetical protein BV210_10470 [Halorientalis sp. IM1011]